MVPIVKANRLLFGTISVLLLMLVAFRRCILSQLLDSYRVEYAVNYRRLLADSLTVLQRSEWEGFPSRRNRRAKVDIATLPQTIQSIGPTSISVEGRCLVIERYLYASAYGYVACPPGEKPTGFHANFIPSEGKKLDGLYFYSTPNK